MSKRLIFQVLLFLFLGAVLGMAAPPDAATGDAGTPMTAWDLVRSGGWVMIPLGVASIMAVAMIVFNFLTLRESAISTPEMIKRIQPFLENEDLQGFATYVAERPQAVARVMDQTLKFLYRHSDADTDAIHAVAQAEGTRIATQLNQRATYLMDLGVLAPMLGLFGTVIGILRSFGSIAEKASPMRTMLLAGGVSQALISTAIGLVVGITAMAFFSYFRGRVQHLISMMESQCTILVQELVLLRKRRTK